MNMIKTALVVGGGIAGMSAAIELRRRGTVVDLIDLDPQWRVYGAGISITSPSFRAFGELGILDEILAEGYSGSGIRICDIHGQPIEEVRDPDGLPGSGGIMRPVLHRILAGHTRAGGTNVRLGITVASLQQNGEGVDAEFTDGSTGSYDLVLGADGLYSRVRSLIFPDAPAPVYMGQSVWRLFAPRPAWFDRRHFFLGGRMKVGAAPVSRDHLYLFLLEKTERHPIIPDEELPDRMRFLMEGYGGLVGELRDSISPESSIIMRPLEALVLPEPWHKGRILLIGDAAHPTTPQLASGAGMAVEDAVVLGQEIDRSANPDEAIARYMQRRLARCKLVAHNSMEIGRLEQRQAPPAEQTALVAQSLRVLAEPI